MSGEMKLLDLIRSSKDPARAAEIAVQVILKYFSGKEVEPNG